VDGGLAFLKARAKCRYCLHEEACRRWLTIRTPRTSPDFCPNIAFFMTCRSADWAHESLQYKLLSKWNSNSASTNGLNSILNWWLWQA